MKNLANKFTQLLFNNIATNLLLLAILLTIVFCYLGHFQIAAGCLLYIFIYFMFGHISQAFYDITHMSEYRERVNQKRQERQDLKEYLRLNTSRKRWILF